MLSIIREMLNWFGISLKLRVTKAVLLMLGSWTIVSLLFEGLNYFTYLNISFHWDVWIEVTGIVIAVVIIDRAVYRRDAERELVENFNNQSQELSWYVGELIERLETICALIDNGKDYTVQLDFLINRIDTANPTKGYNLEAIEEHKQVKVVNQIVTVKDEIIKIQRGIKSQYIIGAMTQKYIQSTITDIYDIKYKLIKIKSYKVV